MSRAGASAPLGGMDGRRRPLPCTNASRLLPSVDSLLETEVQNIVAFLEARANVRSTPTTAQDAAVAVDVGQWPDDTEHGRGAASHRKTPPPLLCNLNLP